MDRAVALHDVALVETRFLELTIDIGGEDKTAIRLGV
jgi:hypothetical protein